jgi:DNA-binding XRE family transcriptional regulator
VAQKGPKTDWPAARVRALRRHLIRTQAELASELGVRQQTVSEWETGLYQPRGASRTLLNLVAERANFAYEAAPRTEREKPESTRSLGGVSGEPFLSNPPEADPASFPKSSQKRSKATAKRIR